MSRNLPDRIETGAVAAFSGVGAIALFGAWLVVFHFLLILFLAWGASVTAAYKAGQATRGSR